MLVSIARHLVRMVTVEVRPLDMPDSMRVLQVSAAESSSG
jgi:hypothetical protein